PGCGNSWNTLGVAYYRAKSWLSAIDALKQSMNLRDGGDSADWFFMAMAYKQLGDDTQANYWYNKAKLEVQKANLSFEPLSRYRKEAEALLEGRCPSKEERRAPKRAAWIDLDILRLAAPMLPGMRGDCST